MKKPFKNRLTQESESFLNELKSKVNIVIKDKCYNPSYQGLYAFSINPRKKVDAITLEKDFESALSHFYHWRYGSKWYKLKNIQKKFSGIIEKQKEYYHLHLTIYEPDEEELKLFIAYIFMFLKSKNYRPTYQVEKIYNIKRWFAYINPLKSYKDNYTTKRRTDDTNIIYDRLFTKMIEKIKEVPSEIEQVFSDYLNQYKDCRLQKVLYGLH